MACRDVESISTSSKDLSHLFTVSAAIPPIYNFMNLDSDFVAFRKFKRLHLYSLLYEQRKLASIDKKLEDLDSEEFLNDESTTENRMKILRKLAPLLRKYGTHGQPRLFANPRNFREPNRFTCRQHVVPSGSDHEDDRYP